MNDKQSCEIKSQAKCQIIINFHDDEKTKTSIPRRTKSHIIKENIIDFENDTINIDSLDSSKGILKFFISINNEKIKNNNDNEPNYYIIKLKDIPIKNDFQDLSFNIVNNIEINLSIKVKNIIGGGEFASKVNMFRRQSKNFKEPTGPRVIISTGAGVSVKEKLKMLNKRESLRNSALIKNKVAPKKIQSNQNHLLLDNSLKNKNNKINDYENNEKIKKENKEKDDILENKPINININEEEKNENDDIKINKEKYEIKIEDGKSNLNENIEEKHFEKDKINRENINKDIEENPEKQINKNEIFYEEKQNNNNQKINEDMNKKQENINPKEDKEKENIIIENKGENGINEIKEIIKESENIKDSLTTLDENKTNGTNSNNIELINNKETKDDQKENAKIQERKENEYNNEKEKYEEKEKDTENENKEKLEIKEEIKMVEKNHHIKELKGEKINNEEDENNPKIKDYKIEKNEEKINKEENEIKEEKELNEGSKKKEIIINEEDNENKKEEIINKEYNENKEEIVINEKNLSQDDNHEIKYKEESNENIKTIINEENINIEEKNKKEVEKYEENKNNELIINHGEISNEKEKIEENENKNRNDKEESPEIKEIIHKEENCKPSELEEIMKNKEEEMNKEKDIVNKIKIEELKEDSNKNISNDIMQIELEKEKIELKSDEMTELQNKEKVQIIIDKNFKNKIKEEKEKYDDDMKKNNIEDEIKGENNAKKIENKNDIIFIKEKNFIENNNKNNQYLFSQEIEETKNNINEVKIFEQKKDLLSEEKEKEIAKNEQGIEEENKIDDGKVEKKREEEKTEEKTEEIEKEEEKKEKEIVKDEKTEEIIEKEEEKKEKEIIKDEKTEEKIEEIEIEEEKKEKEIIKNEKTEEKVEEIEKEEEKNEKIKDEKSEEKIEEIEKEEDNKEKENIKDEKKEEKIQEIQTEEVKKEKANIKEEKREEMMEEMEREENKKEKENIKEEKAEEKQEEIEIEEEKKKEENINDEKTEEKIEEIERVEDNKDKDNIKDEKGKGKIEEIEREDIKKEKENINDEKTEEKLEEIETEDIKKEKEKDFKDEKTEEKIKEIEEDKKENGNINDEKTEEKIEEIEIEEEKKEKEKEKINDEKTEEELEEIKTEEVKKEKENIDDVKTEENIEETEEEKEQATEEKDEKKGSETEEEKLIKKEESEEEIDKKERKGEIVKEEKGYDEENLEDNIDKENDKNQEENIIKYKKEKEYSRLTDDKNINDNEEKIQQENNEENIKLSNINKEKEEIIESEFNIEESNKEAKENQINKDIIKIQEIKKDNVIEKNEIVDKKEENEEKLNSMDNYILKKSICIKSSLIAKIGNIMKENIKEEKEEEENKNELKEMDPKMNLSTFPTNSGSKTIIKKNEKNTKIESKNKKKENSPKKLSSNRFVNLLGNRIIGQFVKKPNELLKKQEKIKPKNDSLQISSETQSLNDNNKLNKIDNPKIGEKTENNNEIDKENITTSDFDFEIVDSSNSNDNRKEEFLDSINYEDFLIELKNQGIKESPRESFCEGFFVASIPKKDGKVIENSAEKLPASCGHKECSRLSSMKPEIIMRYPLNDTKKLELNNLAATICFPTGIKLCYSESSYPKPIKDYVTQITNQKGERYYMRTFHFYHKMDNIEFTKEYEIHPLKHHLMKFGDEYTVLSEDQFTNEIVNNIQKNLDFCQELGFREIVYIPYCLCLISKYSYTKELEYCLYSIYKIMGENQDKLNFEINELIMYLIHSIPIPIKNMRVKFYIPYYNSHLELLCPKDDDVSIMNSTFTKLFDYLSVDNIILVFRLLLSEKKILFIHDDYTVLTNITDSFISLLYPFKWVHTYIPIMSDQMLKYLETFLPFLNGIHESLMKYVEDVFKEGELEESEEVFLIYINKDEIKLSSSLKKKNIKLSKYIQNNVLPLPFEKDLKKDLKSIEFHKKLQKKNKYSSHLEKKMRKAFIKIFVKMFQDYEKYIGILDDDVIFNKVLFMNSIKKDEKFYDEFIDSQLFQQFTQNLLNDNYYYFNKKIRESKEKKHKEKKNKENEKSTLNNKDITYLVRPDYLGVKENNINIIEKILNNYKIDNESLEIKNKILTNLNPIVPNKYINSKCRIFLIPENKNEIKDDTSKKKLLEIKRTGKPMLRKVPTLLGGELTEKQIDIIKDDIKEMVIKIFKSQIDEDYKALKMKAFRNFETSYGRSFFVSLISNNNNNIISLQENSFIFLDNLIYGFLTTILKLAETPQIIEEVVILIKSTKFFQKEVKGSKKGNENLFISMKKKFQHYNKINQKNLWEKWFELSLKKLKKEEQENDKVKENLIIDTCKEMFDLEISKSIIKNVCDNINKKIFEEGSLMYESTKKKYIYLISHSKFISKAK